MQNRDHPVARPKKPRKRTVLPEFEKLMAKKPGDDIQAALDEVRGDDPGVIMANSAPASFPPQDVARPLTNTSELADFAGAELAKTRAALPLLLTRMNTKPKMLSGKELGRLAEKMCAATDPKEVDKLKKEFMEGFYGRHFLPEELRLPSPSREAIAREEQEWIRKIRTGEATEI